MPPPRSDFGLDSPMVQRSASRRLDLPQPFGPTTPLRPGSIWSSVGSTKDLKPLRRSRLNFKTRASLRLLLVRQSRIQQGLQRVVGNLSRVDFAVDDEGRCRFDLVPILAFLPIRG